MDELVLSSYVKIMQEGFSENNKQEAAFRLLLDSIMCQEEANCMTDLTSKKISNVVNRKDPVPDDIYLASSKESVIKGVHSYFSDRIMKELNPHLKFDVLEKIANGEKLDLKYRNHSLMDDKLYKGCYECHINPDWLLVYRIVQDKIILLLVTTGSHSELFGK